MVFVPDVPMSTPRKTLILTKTPWRKMCWLAAMAVANFGCGGHAGVGDDSARHGATSDKAASRVVPDLGRASVTLRLAVVNDAHLADAIRRLRGEWAELSGGELVVDAISDNPFGENDSLEADLVIFASRHLGQYCEEQLLRPVRAGILANEALAFDDIYPATREREIVYGRQVLALPIGCPTPLLVVDESEDAIVAWGDLDPSRGCRVRGIESDRLAAAYQFLARAACYAIHPAREAVLFDPVTLKPRLAEPPFVLAMDQTIASIRSREESSGRFVLTWPGRGEETADGVNVSALPGARRVFSPLAKQWESVNGQPQRVTVLATSGRLVGVMRGTRNATSAFRLAAWLAGPTTAAQLATASPHVAVVRQSLAATPDNWLGGDSAPLGRAFARALNDAMRNRRTLTTPRILQVDEYLDSLGEAAIEAAAEERPASVAIESVISAWEELTDQAGRSRQRRAYLRSLGIEDFEAKAK